MLRGRWSDLAFGRVNAFVPAVVVFGGLLCFALGYRWVGAGIAVGAVLALINGVLLSRRVEVAADTGDMGRALLIMQLGLLLTFSIIGVTTIILVKISLAMAVASAAGFAVAQMAMLATFYWTRARGAPAVERKVL